MDLPPYLPEQAGGVDLSLPICKKTLTTEYVVLLQSLRARNGYTEDTEAFVLFFSVCSVYSVVKKSFEVFFVDENALIACWERGLNENTDGLIRQSLLEFNL